jgi:CRP/FNR family transcriptional regulator
MDVPLSAPPVPLNQVAARRASCLSCPARSSTVCAPLPDVAIDRVALIKNPSRRLPAGATIYAEQDQCAECFTVLEGWVALVAANDEGGRVVLGFALPGDYFGFVPNPLAPRAHSAVALTPVRLCPLPRGGMQPLIASDPALAKRLAHLEALHAARADEHLVSTVQHDARGRIARLLVALCFRLTRALPAAPGQVFLLPLTLAVIGESTGHSPEHVSRSLHRMAAEGMLRFRRGRLTVLDPAALIAAAGVSERPLADMLAPA